MLTIMFALVLGRGNQMNAASGLQVMKTSTGKDMVYRGSSEKVYGLSEYDYPTAEYRAAWVSTFVSDIPTYTTEAKFKADSIAILDDLVSMGMNAVVFHVRTHNNALYNSDLNPIASWWKTVDFDTFDPLEWFINECHARGMEFHAWMNPYRVGEVSSINPYGFGVGEPYPANHPCNNPELMLTSGSSTILDPASPIVRQFIVDSCMEFLDRYDADAIHFDDYFYISNVATELTGNQKRANVDAFIKKLSDTMREMNQREGRAVQLGISPSGIYQNGGYASNPIYDTNGTLISPINSNTSGFAHYDNYLYSDTKKWIDNEWIDYITPQAYWGMEHTGANFFELSRWWSWCVKYKKVNLYMGVGIYMAEENPSPGSSAEKWQKNPNEVQNQLLNAGMYDEINGICFYKYSTLKNKNNQIINNGVNLIKNDYWKKRVPGAPIPQYANSIPSIEVTNITLNGNTLSWNKIDNVFGYMVYQVPKGQALDTNNIDHVLEYTQKNSIDNINLNQYDYYISSVNRANVKSNPVKYDATSLLDPYEQVILAISTLPTEITLEHGPLVQNARTLYNALSTADQTKVTNYNILVLAEEKLEVLHRLKTQWDAFVSTLDKKINQNRILPKESNMKWSYVHIEDAVWYNLATGERLKNYLTSVELDLYLEVKEGTTTYRDIVTFDLGILEEGKIALIYRNDPSAMSPDHIGQYTGTSSYIGWSNATVTVGNNVLFVASGNYHELTSSNIPSCHWTSCAGVYYNKTKMAVTMKIQDAFTTESASYGYFIIGSNQTIRYIGQSSPLSESITLQSNEALVLIRYLDSQITGSPWLPASKLTVGTTAYVTSYNQSEATPEEQGQAVANAISTLPNPITIEDEELVKSIQNMYDALSTEAKAYVSNYQILQDALETIVQLKEELEQHRNNATTTLNSYVNPDEYKAEDKEKILQYLKEAIQKISKSTSLEEIDTIVLDTKNKIDVFVTIEEELLQYKNQVIEEMEIYVDEIIENYSTENQSRIQEYLNDAKTFIYNVAGTKIEIDQQVMRTKSLIGQLPTLEEELEAYRNELKEVLYEYVDMKDYSRENQQVIDVCIYNAELALNAATTKQAMDEIVADAKENIDNVPTLVEELQRAKDNATSEITTYIDLDDYEGELKATLQGHIEEALEAVSNETVLSNIATIVSNAKGKMNIAIFTDYATKEKDKLEATIQFSHYSLENQAIIREKLQSILSSVTIDSTKNDIDTKVANVSSEIEAVLTISEELLTAKTLAAEELTSFVQNHEQLNTTEKTHYLTLVQVCIQNINHASEKEVVEEIKTLFLADLTQKITELQTAKNEVRTYIENLSVENLSSKQKQQVNTLIETMKAELESLTLVDSVNALKAATVQEYESIVQAKSGCDCNQNASIQLIMTIATLSLCIFLFRKKQ